MESFCSNEDGIGTLHPREAYASSGSKPDEGEFFYAVQKALFVTVIFVLNSLPKQEGSTGRVVFPTLW